MCVGVVSANVGGEFIGTGDGGELTRTGVGGELTGITTGGVAAGGVAVGGVATGGVVAGAGATALNEGDAIMEDETGRVAIAALGDEDGGDEVREAAGAIDFGLEGVVAGNAINTFF
ncbi:hypothetical protein GYH30_005472 [Glycine max]|nr:hypothetical protein GYH30_005472 [Glycine max]